MHRLSIHARHIASAFESALLFRKMEQRIQELTALNNMFQEYLKIYESRHKLVARIRILTNELNCFIDSLDTEDDLDKGKVQE